jgi:hypothetical protein
MQPNLRVVIKPPDERQITGPEDIDRVCADLARLPAFTATFLGERGYEGPFLDVTFESGRAIVFYMDMDRGIERISRDHTCTRRGTVSLNYPDLELDHVEVYWRDIIPLEQALAILRQYLSSGEIVDLVPWPSDDDDEWGDVVVAPDAGVAKSSAP